MSIMTSIVGYDIKIPSYDMNKLYKYELLLRYDSYSSSLATRAPWYIKFLWGFFNLNNAVSLLVTIVYYALLAPGYAPVYTVLDWSNTGKTSLLVCLLILVGIPLMHLVCFSIQTLRLFLSWKWQCSKQKVSDDEHMKSEIKTCDVELQDSLKSAKAADSFSNSFMHDSK